MHKPQKYDLRNLCVKVSFIFVSYLIAPHLIADQVYWSQGTAKGSTPHEAAAPACDGYVHCTHFNIRPYFFDPTRQDLRSVEYMNYDGSMWKRETVRMLPCGWDDYHNCTYFNPDFGMDVCEDGFYTDAANHYGFIDTCDRPELKMCDSGVIQLSSGICPVESPVCTDYEDCLNYARDSVGCDGAVSEKFTFIDNLNWSYTCEFPEESPEEPPWYGCDDQWCGGIDHVSYPPDEDGGDDEGEGDDSNDDGDNGNGSGDNGNGSDENGNGTGDSGDGNSGDNGNGSGNGSASGGTNCESPPTCSGDSIACAQLFQQWRQRCPSTQLDDFHGLTFSTDLEQRVALAIDDYTEKFDQIRDDLSSLFDLTFNSIGGGLTSDTHTVHGRMIELGSEARNDFFSIIRDLIFFGFCITAFMIIMRKG